MALADPDSLRAVLDRRAPSDGHRPWRSVCAVGAGRPRRFHALGSVTAGAEDVPDQGPCRPDPAEGERLTSYGPLGCRYLARRSCRLSILCDYHHRAYLRLTQVAPCRGLPTAVHADRTVRLYDPAGDR